MQVRTELLRKSVFESSGTRSQLSVRQASHKARSYPPPSFLSLLPLHQSFIRTRQYADDLIIYPSTKIILLGESHLISYLDELYHYFTIWELALNPQKCQPIVFQGCLKLSKHFLQNIENISLRINNSLIPNTNNVNTWVSLWTPDYIMKDLLKANLAFYALGPILLYRSPILCKK